MTREEKQKAINALKISVPIKALTQEKFNDYIQTLNKVMDWLEQEPCEDATLKDIFCMGCEYKELTIQECQAESDKIDAAYHDGYNNGYAQARFDYEQEPTTKNDLTQERYQDLIDYFGDEEVANTILEDRKEFKAWLERVKWHVKRADELARELEQLKSTTKNDSGVEKIEVRKPCINYEDGCEEWAGCPCVHYQGRK